MKFPLSWLKEYIDVDLPAIDIAKLLTSAGLEVDGITTVQATTNGSAPSSKQEDFIFEVSLTPNLGHCASLLGVARELSAALEKPIRASQTQVDAKGPDIHDHVSVEIKDFKSCPRYACRLVQGVKMGPSPEWMQTRLTASGIRPINNIVDITNYVLLESGQPLHAFDFDKLKGGKIIVRTATQDDVFVTLDGQERVLSTEDLLICDEERPIAIAGVMGGLNSEVDESSTNVLIEAAYFNPTSIRRTSKRLGLQTDASKRFERHVDPQNVLKALDRAAWFMQEIAQGNVCKALLDHSEASFDERVVNCRLSRINLLLGTQLGVSEVENIFHRLDFLVHWDNLDTFTLNIPTYRADILQEIDLIEEVARIYGYDNIITAQPYYHASTLPNAPAFLFENEVRSRLLTEGLQEFLTCDLIGPSMLKVAQESLMPNDATIRVLNPTSIEQSVLRTSLLPGLLQTIKYNWSHQIHDISGFEIGRIHFKEKENYREQSAVGIIMSGKTAPLHWRNKPEEIDFFDLKGVIEVLMETIGVERSLFQQSSLPAFHPGRQLAIYVGSLEIGSFGEVHPSIVRRLDVPQRIFFAEINLSDLFKVRAEKNKMHELALFPGSTRDWTIKLQPGFPIEAVFKQIDTVKTDLLEKVILLDLYENEALGAGVRNATFHFVYRDKEKTLSQESVDAEHWRLVDEIMKIVKR
ncbi:MAG: phenylalanine--tRNA ligase subunit beta [Parachlamydiaceae bacterium]|nr:phenylalanine--tRNA ligase subunit beta [Parachlamydiaceae bacterium]